MSTAHHLLVVEAYDGMLEFLSANPEERAGARGLGLPVAELANRLNCRVTVLTWDEWLRYETTPENFFSQSPFPATRALSPPGPAQAFDYADPRIRARPVPARDPGHGQALTAQDTSPLSKGLLWNSDPLFLLSHSLRLVLEALLVEDPFDAVMVPMWGGLGYVAQMARATGATTLADIPFVTVVTDGSAARHERNGEGLWTRPGVTRRQMEDVSLALADLALVFGPRGAEIARSGRLPDGRPPVLVPRRIPDGTLERLSAAAVSNSAAEAIELFLEEPQDGASGVLCAMDAVAALSRGGTRFDRPFVSAGPPVMFAPMKYREFRDYWSSRGFVRELIRTGCWVFREREAGGSGILRVRIYPSGFEHLPSIWGELGRGSSVLLSAAAAEGLAPVTSLPGELFLANDPDPSTLSAAMSALLGESGRRLDERRRELCARVAAGLSGLERAEAMETACDTFRRLLRGRPTPQLLDRAARLFLDRTTPLGRMEPQPVRAVDSPGAGSGRLSVVVACHNMGGFVAETLESVWRSDRMPDEVLLVDDGSDDPATLDVIKTLQAVSAERSVPLTLLRQRNRGLAGARNAGLAAATGEFISFIDADDLIEPEFYRLALEVMRTNPGLGGVAAWARMFGEGMLPGFWNAPQPELPLLLVENTVIVPCLMRTAKLRALGGYDQSQRYNYEDWELSVRLLAAGHPIVTIPRYLQRYRMRRESLWRTMSEVQNQSMRERMFARHRETASRFAVEVAMQLEHRLMQRVYEPGLAPPALAARDLVRSTRYFLSSLIRRAKRRI